MSWAWQWRRRINHLNEVATMVAEGDLTVRANETGRWRLGSVNQTINHMLRRTEALVSSQRFLTNSVAHELRTPLSRMQFIVESLPGTAAKHATELNEELDNLNNLINEVMGYARADYKQAEQRTTQHNLAQIIQQESDRHAIHCPMELDNTLTARASKGQLERMLTNLFSNAAKYAGGITFIRLQRQTNKTAEMIIEDNGPGIPAEAIDRIFEPFYRGRNDIEGFGFGLAIVQQIAEQLGGDVSVTNKDSGGARFTVRLPIS